MSSFHAPGNVLCIYFQALSYHVIALNTHSLPKAGEGNSLLNSMDRLFPGSRSPFLNYGKKSLGRMIFLGRAIIHFKSVEKTCSFSLQRNLVQNDPACRLLLALAFPFYHLPIATQEANGTPCGNFYVYVIY